VSVPKKKEIKRTPILKARRVGNQEGRGRKGQAILNVARDYIHPPPINWVPRHLAPINHHERS